MARQWNRRRLLWLIPVILVGLVWWASRPAYLDLALPVEPIYPAFKKSYSTFYTPDVGGSTYYVVRWQGLVQETKDWPREKVFEYFDEWLVAHGWDHSGSEQDYAGIFGLETYEIDASHRRYKKRGAPESDYAHVCVTVLHNRDYPAGGHVWIFAVESVNPSWFTSVMHNLDD